MLTIDHALDRLNQAWNDGDAAAYAANFTTDATYVVYDGTLLVGRLQIEGLHRFLFDGPLRGSRLGTSGAGSPVTALRLVRPDVAHAVLTGGVRPDGQETVTADRASVISLLLVADDERWLVSAFHNTRRS